MFKFGDKVKRNKNKVNGSLTDSNTVYLVIDVDKDNGNIELYGFSDYWMDKNNFELAKPKKRFGPKLSFDTEEKQFLALMKKFRATTIEFKDKRFIISEALKDKAVVSYDIHGVSFSFNAKGEYVGVNNEHVGSYESRESKKKRK